MPTSHALQQKNQKTAAIVAGVVVGMVALSFASVPLYSLFCRVTGFAGTTQVTTQVPDQVLEREITVRFNTDVDSGLPWTFEAEATKVTLPIGQQMLANFRAENQSGAPITGTSIYNVSPPKAGKYFFKTQCFCFDEQTLEAGQSMNFPVVFYVDPAMDEDPAMDDVSVITLSYTFFESNTSALDSALERFYNAE